MKIRVTKSGAAISVLIVALIFIRITFHYSEFGFFEFLFFCIIPKWLLFIFPITALFYRIARKYPLINSFFDFVLAAIGGYIIYYILSAYHLDKIDWNINYAKRVKIVQLAKANKLEKGYGGTYLIPDSLSLAPYFKSNEVAIQRLKDTFVTMIFYTDTGLLDHYSGFVYTNDTSDIQMFDKEVENGGNDFKLQKNWYLINN